MYIFLSFSVIYGKRSFKYDFIYWNEVLIVVKSIEGEIILMKIGNGRQHVHCQEQR